jgi:hypothetical protein
LFLTINIAAQSLIQLEIGTHQKPENWVDSKIQIQTYTEEENDMTAIIK